MLQRLDPTDHETRIRNLMTRFQTQERFMAQALNDLQERLEHWHHEASYLRRDDATATTDPILARCAELEEERDELATELSHVRLAICGAFEELGATAGCQRLGA
ncbi:MAG: hypothetical protein KAI24_22210 [Planctomycetes bacterium]|nr:hypothetical protein [Planctomycetota bacterium]